MTFEITIEPSGRQFEVQAGEVILAAGIRQGIGLPYGCKDGACGSCKCKLLHGQVKHGPHQAKALSTEEEAAGLVLTCCASPQSDVVLESKQVGAADAFPIKKMPTRVISLEKVAPDVMRLQLQLPAAEGFAYHPGQYIDFLLRDGARRSYSMANAPQLPATPSAPHSPQPSHSDRPQGTANPLGGQQTTASAATASAQAASPAAPPRIELHVRHMPGGLFTDQVFSSLKEKDILRIEGPFGSFYLRQDSDKPIVLLASGTGFAPIKAILEQMQQQGNTRRVSLYWGGRRPLDLYLHDWVLSQVTRLPQLCYVPVVSDALAEDAWRGRTGFVHQAVVQDWPDLSGHEVYACGAPVVVESARRDYVQHHGLPESAFFADAFTSAADKN